MLGFNWELRPYLKELRDDGRLNVLTALMMHANEHNRCFPSQRLLAEETGYSVATVNKAMQWLRDHYAIEIVAYDMRANALERSLPPRKHVYQLTGIIYLDEKLLPYSHMSPEALEAQKSKVQTSIILASKIITTKHKVSSLSKDSTREEKVATPLKESKAKVKSEKQQLEPSKQEVLKEGVIDILGAAGLLDNATPFQRDMINDWIADHGEIATRAAVLKAIDAKANNLSYIDAILNPKTKPEQVSNETSPIDELAKAYQEANKMIAFTPNRYDTANLRALIEAKITPDDLRKFIEFRLSLDWWSNPDVKLKHIVENIGAWKAGQVADSAPVTRWQFVDEETESAA